MNWQHFIDLQHRETASGIVGSSPMRPVRARIPGGLVGLEREQRKASKVPESATSLGRVERE